MRRLGRIFRGCTRGTAAVEFAIVGSVLVTLLIATLDFGRTYYVKNQVSALADEAVRKVLLNPSISDSTLTSELRSKFTAGDSGQLTISITNSSSGGTNYRMVTVGYPLTLFIPFLTSDTVALNVKRRVPLN